MNIVFNISLNVLYLIVFPHFKINPFGIYDANFTLDVVWVFYINMFCSVATLLLLWKSSAASGSLRYGCLQADAVVYVAAAYHGTGRTAQSVCLTDNIPASSTTALPLRPACNLASTEPASR